MLLTTVSAYSIRRIEEIRRDDGGAWLTCQGGCRARLDSSHPHFEHLLWLAEWSQPSRPVGIVTDGAGRIVDLNVAHDTGVAWVRALPTDSGRFRVAFWAYSPICGLTREHPEFDRIYASLLAAAGTAQPLWVATHSEDTVDDEPDEEGLSAALPKILDVRTIDSPHAVPGQPGIATA
jgi:hypothetical protein